MNFVAPVCTVTFLGEIAIAQASGWNLNELSQTDPVVFQATALLTVVAMKFSFASSLPPGLSKATLLDQYLLACIAIIASSAFVIVHVDSDTLNEFRGPLVYLVI